MLTKYLKQAPTFLVIGVTGFVAWPILFPEGESTASKGSSKPPESARPSASIAALSRSPFQLEQAAAVALAAPAANSTATAPASADPKTAPLPDLSVEDEKVIAGLRLSGTFVDGREQLALIDNKIYTRGDALKAADGSPMPYIVAEVRKDRAVLRRGRRNFVLEFSNTPRPALAKADGPRTLAKDKDKNKPDARPETTARIDPSATGKALAQGRPRADSGDPRQMLMQLLSGLGGLPSGGSTAAGSAGTDRRARDRSTRARLPGWQRVPGSTRPRSVRGSTP